MPRSEEHTSELQSRVDLVCRLLLEKKKREINGLVADHSLNTRCYVFAAMLEFRFFFYCCGDHRDLHSFPTRRSSDLKEPLHHRVVARRGPQLHLLHLCDRLPWFL